MKLAASPFRSSARVLCYTIGASVLFCQAGCDKKPSATAQDLATEIRAREEFATHMDKSFEEYLGGNADHAFRALNEMAQFAQDSKVNLRVRAHILWLVYARLYVFELRSHHQSVAEADLVKTRYWFLQEREQSGESPDEAGKSVQSLTGEKCEKIISKWDRDLTNGKGPKYLRLQATQPAAK